MNINLPNNLRPPGISHHRLCIIQLHISVFTGQRSSDSCVAASKANIWGGGGKERKKRKNTRKSDIESLNLGCNIRDFFVIQYDQLDEKIIIIKAVINTWSRVISMNQQFFVVVVVVVLD